MRLTGREAIEYARENGLTLSKYTDPIEDYRDGLTIEEAEKVAAEDPSLIWVAQDRATFENPVSCHGCGQVMEYSDANRDNGEPWCDDCYVGEGEE